jgi:hypothetical protein
MDHRPEFGQSEAGRETEARLRTEAAKEDLRSFYESLPEDFKKRRNLKELTDRVQRGMNPMAALAIKPTAEVIGRLEESMRAKPEEVMDIAAVMQGSGPWEYAKEFKTAENPAVRLWMMLSAATTMGRDKEMDLTPAEFVGDLERVGGLLTEAEKSPDEFYERSREHIFGGLVDAKEKRLHVIEDGVPISEIDDGFIYMALEGYESGVIIDADGMLFVGAKGIDDATLTKWGLKAVQAKDERGRTVTYFQNEQGENLVKKLYPGFAIIENRNFELAKAVARAAVPGADEPRPSDDALGHAMFEPTSAEESSEEDFKGVEFMRAFNKTESKAEPSGSTAMIRMKDLFYDQMRIIKSMMKSLDAVEAAEKLKARSGKTLKERDKEKIALKEWRKMDQKVEELTHLIDAMKDDLAALPEAEATTVMDMAGGAGDLGLAVSMQMLAEGRGLKETKIIDPFSKKMGLDHFMGLIIDASPFRNELKEKVHQTYEPLQEAEITPDALVVAKHACGTLSDDILEKWVKSESPMVCLMTCCQEKAADYSPRYGFTRAEWKMFCKDSGGTGALNPKELDEFMKKVGEAGKLDAKSAEQAVIRAANSEPFRPQVWDGLWEALLRDKALTPESEELLRAEVSASLAVSDEEWSGFLAGFRKEVAGAKNLLEGNAADKVKDAQLKEKTERRLKAQVWKFWFGKWFKEKEGMDIDLPDNTATYLRGLQVMTRLDRKRVEYLKRRGFEAELKQTTKFPKGDIIVARRKKAPLPRAD